jgi:hypothetical protein
MHAINNAVLIFPRSFLAAWLLGTVGTRVFTKNEKPFRSPFPHPGLPMVPYGALHLLGGFAELNVTAFLTFPETILEAEQAHRKNISVFDSGSDST